MKALYVVLSLVAIIGLCGKTRAQDPKPIFDRAVAQLQANDIDAAGDKFRKFPAGFRGRTYGGNNFGVSVVAAHAIVQGSRTCPARLVGVIRRKSIRRSRRDFTKTAG